MYYYYDPTLFLILPALIVSAFAQFKISQSYRKYSEIKSQRGLTGEQVASNILRQNGIYDVDIELVSGKLTDHYDSRVKKIRLSRDVFYGTSIASIGIAAHEVGHAIQYNVNYSPIIIRNKIFPVVSFGSNFSWLLFLMGLILSVKPLLTVGIVLFSFTVIFQLITLPIELNASNRAIKSIISMNLLSGDEIKGAKNVLTSAALTYIASAVMSIMNLVRMLVLSSRNQNKRIL